MVYKGVQISILKTVKDGNIIPVYCFIGKNKKIKEAKSIQEAKDLIDYENFYSNKVYTEKEKEYVMSKVDIRPFSRIPEGIVSFWIDWKNKNEK